MSDSFPPGYISQILPWAYARKYIRIFTAMLFVIMNNWRLSGFPCLGEGVLTMEIHAEVGSNRLVI